MEALLQGLMGNAADSSAEAEGYTRGRVIVRGSADQSGVSVACLAGTAAFSIVC